MFDDFTRLARKRFSWPDYPSFNILLTFILQKKNKAVRLSCTANDITANLTNQLKEPDL